MAEPAFDPLSPTGTAERLDDLSRAGVAGVVMVLPVGGELAQTDVVLSNGLHHQVDIERTIGE
jgi:hypothetical protein